MATAKLYIQQDNVSKTYVFHSDWQDDHPERPGGLRGEQKARNEGERLCKGGMTSRFQIWHMLSMFEVVPEIREVSSPEESLSPEPGSIFDTTAGK